MPDLSLNWQRLGASHVRVSAARAIAPASGIDPREMMTKSQKPKSDAMTVSISDTARETIARKRRVLLPSAKREITHPHLTMTHIKDAARFCRHDFVILRHRTFLWLRASP